MFYGNIYIFYCTACAVWVFCIRGLDTSDSIGWMAESGGEEGENRVGERTNGAGRTPITALHLVPCWRNVPEERYGFQSWNCANAIRAVAVLRGDSNVKGTVTFEQENESANTTITWNITGHDANAERGMHVHAFGDNTNGCTSAGPHCEFILPCSIFIPLYRRLFLLRVR